MTDIDKLKDRELDVAVAEAKGWRVPTDHDCTDPHCDCIDWYHRDIAAAWELWKELKADGYDTSVYEEGDGLMSFYVCRDKCEECLRRNEVAICYFHDLDELPTAICRSYLKAKASD